MAKTSGSAQFNMNSFSPFMDFSKFMPSSAMPGFNLEALVAMQRQQAEAMQQAGQRAMEAMQALMRRQTEMVRESWQETSSMMSEIAAAGTPEEKVACQTAMAKNALEKCMSNGRELAEMVTRTNMDAVEALSQCLTHAMEGVQSACAKQQGQAQNQGK